MEITLLLVIIMVIDRYNRFVHLMINMSKIIRKDNNTKNDILEVLNNKYMLQSILNSKEQELKVNLSSGGSMTIKFKDNE